MNSLRKKLALQKDDDFIGFKAYEYEDRVIVAWWNDESIINIEASRDEANLIWRQHREEGYITVPYYSFTRAMRINARREYKQNESIQNHRD